MSGGICSKPGCSVPYQVEQRAGGLAEAPLQRPAAGQHSPPGIKALTSAGP